MIAAVAFVIGSMRPRPRLCKSAPTRGGTKGAPPHAPRGDQSQADAGRREIPPKARLKDLRAQLADAEANLIVGVPLQAETIACPHCGGRLEPLGTDRCDFCGQTVIV